MREAGWLRIPASSYAGISDAVSVIRTHLCEGWLLDAATDRIAAECSPLPPRSARLVARRYSHD